jgi:hypothetical protein
VPIHGNLAAVLQRQHAVRLLTRRLAAAAASMSLVAVVSIWSAAPAAACSCVGHDDAEAFENAAVVFRGVLVDVQTPSTGDMYSSMDPERFIFDVDRVYKGEANARQTVVTARGGESCGLEIIGSGPFLVFAQTQSVDFASAAVEGDLFSGLCSGTRAATAGDDEMFGAADPPVTPAGVVAPDPPPADDGSSIARPVALGAAAVALMITAWLATSLRRRDRPGPRAE